jgi:centromere protein C
MSRNSSRLAQIGIGRRTGLIVPSAAATTLDADGLENPEQLFDAVVREGGSSLDGSSGKENESVRADAGDATVASKKPKVQVRFSLGEEVADQFDPAIKAKHPIRKLISAGKGRRESIDTMDLSSVSTAPSLAKTARTSVGDGDVESSRQSSEENEVAAIVALAAKQAHQQQVSKLHDVSTVAKDIGVDFDDDDLIPPAPPDFSEPVDEMYDDDVLTQPVHDNDVEFPNTNHDDDDDNNEDPDFGARYDDDDVDKNEKSMSRSGKRSEDSSQKMQAKKGRKKKLPKPQSIHDDSESEVTPEPKRKPKKKFNPFKTTFSPKGMPGPRTFTTIPLSDLKEDPPDDTMLRRSKRARLPPLEYWRGEKPVLAGNDFGEEFDGVKNMPVVVGIVRPDPTPYKKRKVVPMMKQNKKNTTQRRHELDDEDAPTMIPAEEPFDASELRKKFHIKKGKTAQLWDEQTEQVNEISKSFCVAIEFDPQTDFLISVSTFPEVVSYLASADLSALPKPPSRKKSDGNVVGIAAQSFVMPNEKNRAFPGYIVGHLILPPQGIKDAESVGMCAQVFTVVRGQAKSVEIAFGDPEHESVVWDPKHAERFLLSVGDNFLVPPGNSYRLQNHSNSTECLLSWTIIRHDPNREKKED